MQRPLQILTPGPLPFVIVTVDGVTWQVTYEWDDGTLWRFDATAGKETRTIFEDHTAGGGGPTVSHAPPSQVTQRVRATLRPSYWQLDGTAQRILDLMAERLSTDGHMTGRLLRQQLGLSIDQTDAAFRRLAVRYVDVKRDAQRRDYYVLRLPGLLESKMRADFTKFVEDTLAFYAAEYGCNANVSMTDIRNLCEATGITEIALAKQYLAIARLGPSPSQGGEVNTVVVSVPVPADMEQLSEVRTMADFLKYIRTGDRSDLSPSAPLIEMQSAEVVGSHDEEAGPDLASAEVTCRQTAPRKSHAATRPRRHPHPHEQTRTWNIGMGSARRKGAMERDGCAGARRRLARERPNDRGVRTRRWDWRVEAAVLVVQVVDREAVTIATTR